VAGREPQPRARFRTTRAAPQADVVYHASPFGTADKGPQHPFQYDLSFDYEPLTSTVPPVVTVYKLHNCR